MPREISSRTRRKYDLYGWPQKGSGADPDGYPAVDRWEHLRLHLGTSGWAYAHWKGRFYPDRLPPTERLAWYARRLSSVEVNSTYYRLPSMAVMEGWRDAVPPGFTFTLKAPGSITHEKRLIDVDADLSTFLGHARALGDRLGMLLFQFPPALRADLPRLAAFLGRLPSDIRCSFEFRHKSWYERDVYMLLAEHERAFVVHDHNKKGTPLVETAPFVYLRLHGPSGRYRGSYDAVALFQWAMQVREWLERGFEVFVYFNNDERAKATRDLVQLREFIGPAPSAPVAEEPEMGVRA